MLLDIVKQIVAKFGEQILLDPKRVNALFLDLAKDEPKPQKRAFIDCLDNGVFELLKGVAEEDRTNCKETIARRLRDSEGLDVELYRGAIDILCVVLFGSAPEATVKEYIKEPKIENNHRQNDGVINSAPNHSTTINAGIATPGAINPPLRIEVPAPIDVEIEMVFVKGGTFTMGGTSEHGSDSNNDREKPTHLVTLSDYYICKYEVTQGLWMAVMGSLPSELTPSSPHGYGDEYPVYYVSWNDIVNEFLPKLNQQAGKKYRLPTEAEWEYAARGGASSRGYKYSGSNYIGSVAWYRGNSGSKTHPVGGKSPNELGIYDMNGNVWEWTGDWYGSYTSTAQTNPTGPASGSNRVLRGGNWIHDTEYCRIAYRDSGAPDDSGNGVGFRLVLASSP